jgi:hypothetical protein
MGLFDDTASSKKGEVRIGVPDEENDNSKLRSEVESKMDTSSSSRNTSSSSEVSNKELHRQNEKIISLLEKLVDEEKTETGSSGVTDRSTGRNNNRNNDDGMRGGMDELL